MLYYPSIALFFQFTDKLYIELAHIEILDVLPHKVYHIPMRNAALFGIGDHSRVFPVQRRINAHQTIVALCGILFC